MTQIDDPLDAAMEAEANNGPRHFFGQATVDSFFCVLKKGEGKAVYDPNQHSVDERRTAISITLNPGPNSKAKFSIKRDLIAESKEWASIIKPSLRALNTDLRSINGKWIQAELVPTGRKYTNSQGEEKENTTVKFLTVYGSQEECEAAETAFFGGHNGTPPTTAATPSVSVAGNDQERQTAVKFLPALWAASNKDVTEFAKKLAGNPLTSKYFDLNSPEVISLIAA